MEYLIGAIVMMLFFLCFAVGYKVGKKPKNGIAEEGAEEDKSAEERMKEFSQVMNYNLTKALGSK